MGKKIQCIGRYTMDAVTLGKGNFAHVELATHSITEVKVTTVTCYRPAGGQTICPRGWIFQKRGSTSVRESKNRGGSTSVRGRVRSAHISGGWR